MNLTIQNHNNSIYIYLYTYIHSIHSTYRGILLAEVDFNQLNHAKKTIFWFSIVCYPPIAQKDQKYFESSDISKSYSSEMVFFKFQNLKEEVVFQAMPGQSLGVLKFPMIRSCIVLWPSDHK